MKKKISRLGSPGSIGRQALEVIEKLHEFGLDLQPNPEGIDDLELI